MRKIIIGTVLMLLLANLTGCKNSVLPQRKEIDDLQLVQVVGIDKLEDSIYNCMVTIASKNLETEGGQDGSGNTAGDTGSSKAQALILTSEGKTIFDAVRKIQTHSNKTIFWGHCEYYLIGEDAARDNISKYIDFFTRDHELRIDFKVYIVKGSTAVSIIKSIFSLSEVKPLISPVTIFAFVFSLYLAHNRFELENIVVPGNIIFGYIFPLITLIVGKIRGKYFRSQD